MNVKPPPSPFASPFTKALGLEVSYQGHIRIASFRLDPVGWNTVSFAETDLPAGQAADFVLGTSSNAEHGQLVVSPDAWLKAWPGSKAIILGQSDPYPQGNLNYPGGYDPNKHAVPVYLGRLSESRAGVRELKLSAASYAADGSYMECGSHIIHTLDRQLPLLVCSVWLEDTQTGRIHFPRWDAAGAKTISI